MCGTEEEPLGNWSFHPCPGLDVVPKFGAPGCREEGNLPSCPSPQVGFVGEMELPGVPVPLLYSGQGLVGVLKVVAVTPPCPAGVFQADPGFGVVP